MSHATALLELQLEIQMKTRIYQEAHTHVFEIGQHIWEAMCRVDRLSKIRHPRRGAQAPVMENLRALILTGAQYRQLVDEKYTELKMLHEKLRELQQDSSDNCSAQTANTLPHPWLKS